MWLQCLRLPNYGSPGCCYYDAASKEALARIIMAASVVVWRLSVCRCPPSSLWMHLRRASCEVRAPSFSSLLAYLRRLDCSLHFVSQTGAGGQWVCRGLKLGKKDLLLD